MICLTLDLNCPDNFDIETVKISFRRLRQSYANDRRLVQCKKICREKRSTQYTILKGSGGLNNPARLIGEEREKSF